MEESRTTCTYENEIDLREVLLTLWRHRAVILGVFLAAVMISGIVSFFVLTPVYEVTATLDLGNVAPPGSGTTQPVLAPATAQELLQSGDLFSSADRALKWKRFKTPTFCG